MVVGPTVFSSTLKEYDDDSKTGAWLGGSSLRSLMLIVTVAVSVSPPLSVTVATNEYELCDSKSSVASAFSSIVPFGRTLNVPSPPEYVSVSSGSVALTLPMLVGPAVFSSTLKEYDDDSKTGA